MSLKGRFYCEAQPARPIEGGGGLADGLAETGGLVARAALATCVAQLMPLDAAQIVGQQTSVDRPVLGRVAAVHPPDLVAVAHQHQGRVYSECHFGENAPNQFNINCSHGGKSRK